MDGRAIDARAPDTRALRALTHAGVLLEDIADLVLARSCAGCEVIGSVICEHCAALLQQPIRPIMIGDGRIVLAATRYGGTARRVILDYKERGTHSLAPHLGRMLAASVLGCLDGSHDRVALVPIPAHRASVRRRGGDPLATLVHACLRDLREHGLATQACTALRSRLERPVAKSLSRAERAASMRNAFTIRRDQLARLEDVPIVVVDDIVTTGTTIHEAMDAFEAAGVELTGVAALAATPLHLPRGQ